MTDWAEQLQSCDVEGALWPDELAALEAMYGLDWHDLTREELYVAAVYWFAVTVASGLLGTRGAVPAFLFGPRVFELLQEIDERAWA